MKRFIGLLVLAMAAVVVLIGCYTRYQKSGATGGYSDAQIDANTFLVEFRGNGYTSRQTVEKYLLLRCAEVTVEAGYDFFITVGGGVEANTTATQGHFSGSTYGDQTTGRYTPGEAIRKHVGAVRIKVFKGEKPTDNPNAYDAREIMKYLGPSIK